MYLVKLVFFDRREMGELIHLDGRGLSFQHSYPNKYPL